MSGTRAIFLGLSACALASSKAFSFMGGILIFGVLVAFLAGAGAVFVELPALSVTVSAMLTLLMSKLILYETSNIIRSGETK